MRPWPIFLILGLILILAGVTTSVIDQGATLGNFSFGGVILVGPFPIILGSGRAGPALIFLAEIITALALAMFLYSVVSIRRRSRINA